MVLYFTFSYFVVTVIKITITVSTMSVTIYHCPSLLLSIEALTTKHFLFFWCFTYIESLSHSSSPSLSSPSSLFSPSVAITHNLSRLWQLNIFSQSGVYHLCAVTVTIVATVIITIIITVFTICQSLSVTVNIYHCYYLSELWLLNILSSSGVLLNVLSLSHSLPPSLSSRNDHKLEKTRDNKGNGSSPPNFCIL